MLIDIKPKIPSNPISYMSIFSNLLEAKPYPISDNGINKKYK